MNRLTEKIDGIVCSKERYEKYSPCHHCKWQSTNKCLEDNCTYGSTLNKLAEYEDTGLEPGDILSTIKTLSNETNNALEELKVYRNLEEQGLLIKLPCKVGDTLYVPCVNSVMETKVDCIQLKVGVVVFTKNINKHGFENHHWFRESDIGKTVFLTREEAEKALKGAENENI